MRIPTVSASGTNMRIPTRGLTGAYSGGRPNYVLNLHPRLGIRTDILVTRPFKNYITSVDQVLIKSDQSTWSSLQVSCYVVKGEIILVSIFMRTFLFFFQSQSDPIFWLPPPPQKKSWLSQTFFAQLYVEMKIIINKNICILFCPYPVYGNLAVVTTVFGHVNSLTLSSTKSALK